MAVEFDMVRAEELEWEGAAAHRDGGIEFKTLFTGEGGKPNNFWFTLTRVQEYSTPRHHHNFDQVRFMIDGSFGFGPRVQNEGEVGYFSEGSYYEQKSQGPNTHLFLQCEGGSGAQYLSPGETRATAALLAERGEFRNGKYIPEGGEESDAVDGFEAVWEYATGQKVSYTEPRFPEPLIMDPQRFRFLADAKNPGVAHKQLARVGERDLSITFTSIDAGAEYDFTAGEAETTLYFIVEGDGRVDGSADAGGDYGPWTSFRLGAHATASVSAQSATTVLVIGLPV